MATRWLRWIVGVPVALVVFVSAGTWVYLNVLRDDPPERLSLDAAGDVDSDAPPDGGVEGTWKVGPGSQAGYRVPEVLNGQRTEAVGRTSDVAGSLTIARTTVTAATFTVDLTRVTSDESRRDNQFRGRIMDVANHPEATFVLSEPLDVGAVPEVGGRVAAAATGALTLRGTTRPVTFDLEAERTATGFTVAGSIPITFGDFGIPNPSAGPAQVGDEGELEVLLTFAR